MDYDPNNVSTPLTDNSISPNQLAAFQQAVHNDSTAAPQDFTPPEVVSGSTYDSTGQSISIAFNEQLADINFAGLAAQQLDALKSSLRIVVDGHELPSVDAIQSLQILSSSSPSTTDPAMSGMSLIVEATDCSVGYNTCYIICNPSV